MKEIDILYEQRNQIEKEIFDEITKFKKCDHRCWCGEGIVKTPHIIGEDGCKRFICGDPVDPYSLQQRFYYQQPCGCWSMHPDNTNSLEVE